MRKLGAQCNRVPPQDLSTHTMASVQWKYVEILRSVLCLQIPIWGERDECLEEGHAADRSWCELCVSEVPCKGSLLKKKLTGRRIFSELTNTYRCRRRARQEFIKLTVTAAERARN